MEKHQTKRIKRKHRNSFLRLVCSLLLTAWPVAAFYYTYLHHYWRASFYSRGNWLFVLLYTVLLFALMQMYHAYKIRQSRTRELAFSFAISGFLAYAIMYLVMCLISRTLLPVRFAALTLAIQCLGETILYIIFRILIDKIEPKIETLYLFQKEMGSQITIDKLNSHRSIYKVTDAIADTKSWKEILEKLSSFEAVAFESSDQQLRDKIAEYCFCHGKTMLIVPAMADIIQFGTDSAVIEDGLFFSIRTVQTQRIYRILKRIIDILLSFVGLIVTGPLMLGIAVCIKKHDGGPVFYKQIRLTKDERHFELIKFRSMIVNAEQNSGAVLAEKTDRRITPVGRFLRACRLDELPQLWNIFIGDMAIVGPRPERPELYKKYCEEYPEFSYRLKAKAGLTGYAQLYGKYNTTFMDKVKLDVYYIQHESFLLDVQLVFYTLKILFSKESTEGVDSYERDA